VLFLSDLRNYHWEITEKMVKVIEKAPKRRALQILSEEIRWWFNKCPFGAFVLHCIVIFFFRFSQYLTV